MIPDVKPGQPITAEHINRIKRHATRPHTGEGIFETDDSIAHRPISGNAPSHLDLTFIQEGHEWLKCEDRTFTPAVTVYVAKNDELRRSSLDGKMDGDNIFEYLDTPGERTLTGPGIDELHRITPRYYPGQNIRALIDTDSRVSIQKIEGMEVGAIEGNDITTDLVYDRDNRVWGKVKS